MFLCIEDIMVMTPTEEIAHPAAIKGGQAVNEEEMQSSDVPMFLIVTWTWHILEGANPGP